MPIRSTTCLPSTAAVTTICVDYLVRFEPSGRIIIPCLPRPVQFQGYQSIVEIMDRMFDTLNFPQAAFQYRTFKKKKPSGTLEVQEVMGKMEDQKNEDQKGGKATFIVHVQFRQNASWQGTISWAEQKKTQHFRSSFEMLKLMNDALEPQDKLAEWDESSAHSNEK